MKRFTKLLVTAAVSGAALVGLASQAGANVAVTDGVGFVGKGDVQTALGLANDAAMQDLFKVNGSIKFTSTLTRTTDNVWSCTNGVGEQHAYRVTVMSGPVIAVANVNNAGKLTNGWNLTGIGAAPYTVLSDTGMPASVLTCPMGSSVDFAMPFSLNQVGVAKYNVYSYGDLAVNGVALPNTPVVAPV